MIWDFKIVAVDERSYQTDREFFFTIKHARLSSGTSSKSDSHVLGTGDGRAKEKRLIAKKHFTLIIHRHQQSFCYSRRFVVYLAAAWRNGISTSQRNVQWVSEKFQKTFPRARPVSEVKHWCLENQYENAVISLSAVKSSNGCSLFHLPPWAIYSARALRILILKIPIVRISRLHLSWMSNDFSRTPVSLR